MKIVHFGFDTISFAVKGALGPAMLEKLEREKAKAIKFQTAQTFSFSEPNKKAQIKPIGQSGGYAFVIDCGPTEHIISLKKNVIRTEWNGFVKIRAMALVTKGWELCIEQALASLIQLDFHIVELSLNRVDYCIDFLVDNFRIEPSNFVAHSRVKRKIHYEAEVLKEHTPKLATAQSDHIQTITLGKMPRRQVTIYDKRTEVISKRNLFWFKFWGVSKNDPNAEIYRVELRAGKEELKKYGISGFEAFKTRIGDALIEASKAVRYIVPSPSDTNITRAPLHPLWSRVQSHLETALFDFTSNVSHNEVLLTIREQKILEYRQQIIGNCAGLAVCEGLSPDKAIVQLPELMTEAVSEAVNADDSQFWKAYRKAANRLVFIHNELP